jgi:hypothetical protein
MVAQFYNPSYLGRGYQEASLGKSLKASISTNKSRMW